MSDLDLRDDLVERLQKLAQRENRPVDEVLETMLAQYHPRPTPEPELDFDTRYRAFRRKLYEIARRYWQGTAMRNGSP